MGLDYKKLLLDLYNAPNADSLYQMILSYGLDTSEYWKPMGVFQIMRVHLKINSQLLKMH